MAYAIGLTGGIGSGKTVASDHFSKLGVPVIDTDVIARDIVKPNHPALMKLVEAFGKDILLDNGELNRGALREKAFSSEQNKAKLDAITHPAIRAETFKQIETVPYAYCIVVVPLLTTDSPFKSIMQRILVITAPYEIKLERVRLRSNIGNEEIKRIMSTQLSDEERIRFADDVIVNDGPIEEVLEEVNSLHEQYIKLSGSDN